MPAALRDQAGASSHYVRVPVAHEPAGAREDTASAGAIFLRDSFETRKKYSRFS